MKKYTKNTQTMFKKSIRYGTKIYWVYMLDAGDTGPGVISVYFPYGNVWSHETQIISNIPKETSDWLDMAIKCAKRK